MRCRAVLARWASSRSLGKLLLLWVLLAVLGLAGRAQAVDRLSLQRALQSVVLVLVPDANGELLSPGSGTVLDAERGLVLTNFHVLGDLESGEFFNHTGAAAIGVMPDTLRGAPVLRYTARTIAHDRRYDLALLQIDGLLHVMGDVTLVDHVVQKGQDVLAKLVADVGDHSSSSSSGIWMPVP